MSRRIGSTVLLTLMLATLSWTSAWRHADAQTAGDLAPLDVIRTSVDSIRERPVRRRWKIDVELWDLVGDHIGKLDRQAILQIAPRLNDMTMSAAQMMGGQERKRWTANVELWRRLDSHPSPLTRDDIKAMRASFEVLSTPVGDNAVPGDRERWAANCALWRAALDSLSMQH